MNSFAHSLSRPANGDDATSPILSEYFNTVVVLLVAAIAGLLIAGALVYNSMNNEIESLQATQAAVQKQNLQTSAMNACVGNRGSAMSTMTKCRVASETFASSDADTAAFDRAVAYIYPR
jgi:mannitol-specific phosphotransferase system IIBC component